MKKVELRMNEEYKYNIIKKLIDTNGNKRAAALKLKCTLRTINRLIIRYKQYKKLGFIHGNRGKHPSCAFPATTKEQIISLYKESYSDANLVHFSEIIKADLGINVSDTTLNMWLKDEYILSPKANRRTRREMNRTLRSLNKDSKSAMEQTKIIEAIHTLEEDKCHPHRPRSKYFGEMIQMDASSFCWINNQLWHLHLAIDDATNEVVAAYFDTQETLLGYYNVYYQILVNYGIPAMFYTDRRTVFEYKKKNSILNNDDTFTQFAYACKQLGTEIKTTSVPQAKGRIERLNQTFQSRLPVELRRAQAATIEQANEFLKSYLKKFNQQFSLLSNHTKSVFDSQPTIEVINRTLAIIHDRVIDQGHCISYKKKYYLPTNSNGIKIFLYHKSKGLVIEAFNKCLYFAVHDEVYSLLQVPKTEEYSLEFDDMIHQLKPKQVYIPPMSHPWKRDSFLRFLNSQKHRSSDGAHI